MEKSLKIVLVAAAVVVVVAVVLIDSGLLEEGFGIAVVGTIEKVEGTK